MPPEEKEKWNLDRETYLDALDDYMKVERVIGARDGEEEDTEYYVKCTLGKRSLRGLHADRLNRARFTVRRLYMGECISCKPVGTARD